MKSIQIPDIGTVLVQKRKSSSHIRLSLSHDGSIKVSLPYWLPYSAGMMFVKKQTKWIIENKQEKKQPSNGQTIGKNHKLILIPQSDSEKVVSRITSDGEIRVFYPESFSPNDQRVQTIIHKACLRSLKQQADKLLKIRLNELSMMHGLSYSNFATKQLKSRWGSCTSQKDITLNIFLIQLPWHLIDYVLLHELVHTKIMAHGPVFWKEMSKYVINVKTLRKEIKTYQPILLTES